MESVTVPIHSLFYQFPSSFTRTSLSPLSSTSINEEEEEEKDELEEEEGFKSPLVALVDYKSLLGRKPFSSSPSSSPSLSTNNNSGGGKNSQAYLERRESIISLVDEDSDEDDDLNQSRTPSYIYRNFHNIPARSQLSFTTSPRLPPFKSLRSTTLSFSSPSSNPLLTTSSNKEGKDLPPQTTTTTTTAWTLQETRLLKKSVEYCTKNGIMSWKNVVLIMNRFASEESSNAAGSRDVVVGGGGGGSGGGEREERAGIKKSAEQVCNKFWKLKGKGDQDILGMSSSVAGSGGGNNNSSTISNEFETTSHSAPTSRPTPSTSNGKRRLPISSSSDEDYDEIKDDKEDSVIQNFKSPPLTQRQSSLYSLLNPSSSPSSSSLASSTSTSNLNSKISSITSTSNSNNKKRPPRATPRAWSEEEILNLGRIIYQLDNPSSSTSSTTSPWERRESEREGGEGEGGEGGGGEKVVRTWDLVARLLGGGRNGGMCCTKWNSLLREGIEPRFPFDSTTSSTASSCSGKMGLNLNLNGTSSGGEKMGKREGLRGISRSKIEEVKEKEEEEELDEIEEEEEEVATTLTTQSTSSTTADHSTRSQSTSLPPPPPPPFFSDATKRINRRWTTSEITLLKALVQESSVSFPPPSISTASSNSKAGNYNPGPNTRNWKLIAEKLGTGRTGNQAGDKWRNLMGKGRKGRTTTTTSTNASANTSRRERAGTSTVSISAGGAEGGERREEGEGRGGKRRKVKKEFTDFSSEDDDDFSVGWNQEEVDDADEMIQDEEDDGEFL